MRPSIDDYFMEMAKLVATRSTCARRKVGAVLVNHRNHVLATGYNGPPSGFPHCIEKPCAGAYLPSGTGLDECKAIHAETNALLQCHDVHAIKTLYCTASPCVHCVKLMLNTSCERIIFAEEYPHSNSQLFWQEVQHRNFSGKMQTRGWVHWRLNTENNA